MENKNNTSLLARIDGLLDFCNQVISNTLKEAKTLPICMEEWTEGKLAMAIIIRDTLTGNKEAPIPADEIKEYRKIRAKVHKQNIKKIAEDKLK